MAIDLIANRLRESTSLHHALLVGAEYLESALAAALAVAVALCNRKKVLLFGNGGSAADAQHFAAELTGRYLRERPSLAAIALTCNSSCLTAIGNDYSYDAVFSRQIEGLGAAGDVAIGITTSGRSPNILKALAAARQLGMVTVGLTGRNAVALRELADHCISVPSDETPRIQEIHVFTGHIICEIVESEVEHAGRVPRS
jgi:D-sedoheptulose 7-phosphate isomerase